MPTVENMELSSGKEIPESVTASRVQNPMNMTARTVQVEELEMS